MSTPSLTRRALLGATLLGAAVAAQAQVLPSQRPGPLPPDWRPRLVVRDARLPVRVESVDVRAEVIGHAVQTRIELVFRNPNDRVLEGELQFPLREGQWVTGFALDLNGELRPAVPVEKARGQQVFDDVTRARVDPALLEKTEGHNYKLRVYPLPAQGTRRVVLNLAQDLDRRNRLELPLAFGDTLSRLDVSLRVADVSPQDVQITAPGGPAQGGFSAETSQGWTQWTLRQRDASLNGPVIVTLPARTRAVSATQTVGRDTYFYAELPVQARSAPRAAPRTLSLLWDASGSGAARDHEREFAVLDAYFRALGKVEVQLRVGRDTVEPVQRFSVNNGRWDELRRALGQVAYDGASNLSALTATATGDLALLFSDGLSNWGPASFGVPGNVPLYALSIADRQDTDRLRALAERSGGEWLNLATLTTDEAVGALQTRKPRLLRLNSGGGPRDLVAASPYAIDGHVVIAGVLGRWSPSVPAEVLMEFESPSGRIERETVTVRVGEPSDQVAQRWAALRIASLEPEYDDRRAEIRRLGQAFGLVTRETSLIVLDAVADYVRYEIEPPASLRPEYERLVAQQGQRAKQSLALHLDGVARRFAEQVAWWERAFPKDNPRGQEQDKKTELDRLNDAMPSGAAFAPVAPAPMMAEARAARESASGGLLKAKGDASAGGPAPARIQLTRWSPDTPYARRLREASTETVYQRYLDERPDFVNSTAFFLDAADVLFEKGRPALALRVLSNLAEMNLENRHILRVLGYRLLQARQPALAIPVLRTVQRLSPGEPQSWRDLGLAYAEAQQLQEAVDQLWQVVSRPWDSRFPDIDMTALAELNMVAARAQRNGKPVNTDAFDKRLLRNLPLDLRITLAWDADNTDIDLWVIDPNGERAYYGHRLSYQGGRVSQDVTGGYGPEEFALKVAKPGRYVVQAQFYGHRQQVVAPATTVMLRLTTGFGRADQKDEMVTLRLAGQSDLVTVGTFEVGR